MSPQPPSIPQPTFANRKGCSICGEGNAVTVPDAISNNPFNGKPGTCFNLQQAGINGNLSHIECLFYQQVEFPENSGSICKCAPGTLPGPGSLKPTPPTAQPSSRPTYVNGGFCSICGDGKVISVPDAMLESLEPLMPGSFLQQAGIHGVISPEECDRTPPFIGASWAYDQKAHPPAFQPADLCEWRVLFNLWGWQGSFSARCNVGN